MSVFDKYYKKYDAWYEKNGFAYRSELVAVKKALPKSGKGLEIGVGTGRFACPLGIRCGVDASRPMLKIARSRGIKTYLAWGECLPFRKTVFDYVVIIITLCFLKNPRKVLREACRVLKKRGKIIVGLIDRESFLGRYYRDKKSSFYKEARFFSIKEATNLLKSTGFSDFRYYQTLYQLPARMRSVDKPEKGFGRGGFVVIRAKTVPQ